MKTIVVVKRRYYLNVDVITTNRTGARSASTSSFYARSSSCVTESPDYQLAVVTAPRRAARRRSKRVTAARATGRRVRRCFSPAGQPLPWVFCRTVRHKCGTATACSCCSCMPAFSYSLLCREMRHPSSPVPRSSDRGRLNYDQKVLIVCITGTLLVSASGTTLRRGSTVEERCSPGATMISCLTDLSRMNFSSFCDTEEG